ncbi:protein of unknown function [Cetobacterium ceti]|uniref:DUF5058 domain-containing protein n=1 Tax=Cetobacterium ceti TaxID=180163 RepID=A0A1T4P909_9FUSO|nr:DUF5058 family protein [Cetobacterium ceti]SJZ88060.1 protein of unknown function [Cetobacterium ceti]
MNKLGHMNYANHYLMWAVALFGVVLVLVQSALIIRKSVVTGKKLGITDENMKKGIKASALASVGPAMGVVGSLLALIVTMGSAVSFVRLSLIGGSNYEAMAANFGAQAMGAELAMDMLPVVFTNALWTMALGLLGALIFVFFFAHKMDKVNGLLTNGRKALLPAIGLGAMLGSFAFFNVGNLMKITTNPEITVSAIVGAILMFGSMAIGNKKNIGWLKEWSLTISMFGGAFVGTFLV